MRDEKDFGKNDDCLQRCFLDSGEIVGLEKCLRGLSKRQLKMLNRIKTEKLGAVAISEYILDELAGGDWVLDVDDFEIEK